MILKSYRRKEIMWLVCTVILYLSILRTFVITGSQLDLVSCIVALIMTSPMGLIAGKIPSMELKKAYGFKFSWFDYKLYFIDTGMLTKSVAFAIGKEIDINCNENGNYTIILSKGKKKLTEYNRTFDNCTLEEVSTYLDYVAEQIK